MTNRPMQVSTLEGVLQVAQAEETGGNTILTMTFPLGTLDYRNRFFMQDSFVNLGERPADTKALWQHDFFLPPIGSVLSTRIIKESADVKPQLVTKVLMARTELALDIVTLIQMEPPALNRVSIGWIPGAEELMDFVDGSTVVKGRLQQQVRLMDVSPVNFPGMPGTTISQNTPDFNNYALPSHTGRLVQTDDWDEDAVLEQLREWACRDDIFEDEAYAEAFASVSGDPTDFGSYKYLHHDVDEQGLFVSSAGVEAAYIAAQVNNLRTKHTDEGVMAHLEAHREALALDSGVTRMARLTDRLAGYARHTA